METDKPMDRHQRWRKENPEKVKAQQLRKRLRDKGILEPWQKPAKLSQEETSQRNKERLKEYHAKRKARMATDPVYAAKMKRIDNERAKARYERLRNNPEALEAWRLRERNRKRLKRGIPLDAPVMPYRLTDEQRAQRQAEKERLKLERAATRAAIPPKMTPEERKERRRVQAMDRYHKKRDLERQKRAAEVAEAMARTVHPMPTVCPDPPELQELFRKASKGCAPLPYHRDAKKIGAIAARSKWL